MRRYGWSVWCLCGMLALGAAGCGGEKEPEQPVGIHTQDGTEPEGDEGTEPEEGGTGAPGESGSAPEQGTQNGGDSGTPDAAQTDGASEQEDVLVTLGTADEIAQSFRERTLRYAKEMLDGDFSVCGDFSEVLSEELSERDMKSAWKQAVQGLGEPLGADGQDAGTDARITVEASFLNPPASGSQYGNVTDFGGYVITSAQIPYETKNVILSVTYGAAGEVEGIYVTYALPETEPEATESYTEYEVSIGEGDYPLNGLLTLPNGVERPPVVLLVHGSGQSDMNETVGAAGNAPFADIAHGLAERGIATLRYDKRYYQYPELAADTVTIRDEVLDDAALAVRLLAETQQVDGERIYVLGHSLGGMLAPCIAQENPQVAGVISLAGSPRGLWEIIYDQNISAIEGLELDGQNQEELLEMVQEEYDRVLELVAAVRGGVEAEAALPELSEPLLGAAGYYWVSLAEIDTAAIAQELSVPMLILQGSADFQVYPERDFAAWQSLLAGKENVTFQLFEGLNHLFMPSNGAMDATEYDEEGHVAAEVIDAIAEWLNGR